MKREERRYQSENDLLSMIWLKIMMDSEKDLEESEGETEGMEEDKPEVKTEGENYNLENETMILNYKSKIQRLYYLYIYYLYILFFMQFINYIYSI